MQSAHTYRKNSNVVPAEFSLNRPPPHAVGDQQNPASDLLGRFVWLCFSLAVDEKIRLGLIERWKENYRLYRGDHWNTIKTKANRHQVTINLYFANVLRTVANITAKSPSVEILDLDGVNDGADRLFTAKQKKWWSETEQQSGIAFSTLNNEINGITFEKARWDGVNDSPGFSVLDPHTCFPAPGLFENCQKMPYFCHAYIMNIDDVITKYKIEDESTISPDNFDDLLGKGREGVKPTLPGSESGLGSGGYSNNSPTQTSIEAGVSGKGNVLVVEMWYKDKTDPIKYPDGIRVTTVTNCGKLVLKDSANPNINPGSENQRDVSNTFAWGKIPFYFVTSYEDITSIWGFSAAEQTGELNKKIDELVSRLLQYAQRAMLPPLVVESGCGISRSQINNKPGLVLMPRRANARIEFLRVPELPQSFFKVLDILVGFHDRVYQIEDADRGVQPTGVTAASAIVALQERNSVLMAHKIMSIDKLVRQRGRWALSMWQNFSVVNESVEVNGEQRRFRGIDFAERRFNYLVESGSTVARTSLREEEQATQLYKLGVIDRQALLETLNFKDWKAIVERVGEGQLDQALQILVQAGLPEEEAVELRQALMQTQHGGDTALNSSEPKPGTPKAQQG